MLAVDYVGAIFRKWMVELHPNSFFTLNNSTFLMTEGGLSDLMFIFEEKYMWAYGRNGICEVLL